MIFEKLEECRLDSFAEQPFNKNYLLLDFETTGLNPKKDGVIQFASYRTDNGKFDNQLFWDRRYKRTQEFHSYTKDDLKGKGKFKDTNPAVAELIDSVLKCVNSGNKLVLMSYYSDFEVAFLEKVVKKYLKRSDPSNPLCYGNNFKECITTFDPLIIERILSPGVSHSLIESANRAGLTDPSEFYHRAEYDISLMLRLYNDQVRRINSLTDTELLVLMSEYTISIIE